MCAPISDTDAESWGHTTRHLMGRHLHPRLAEPADLNKGMGPASPRQRKGSTQRASGELEPPLTLLMASIAGDKRYRVASHIKKMMLIGLRIT